MKINVFPIIVQHLKTLNDHSTGRVSISDIILFFALPAAISAGALVLTFALDRDAYNVCISAFAIFAALLFNVQVAVFGIMQREWGIADRNKGNKANRDKLILKNALVSELNINISYLIIISCAAICVSLLLYFGNIKNAYATAILLWLVVHFVLTLLMVIKRAFVLFHAEYQISFNSEAH